jgi:hypothetical protein
MFFLSPEQNRLKFSVFPVLCYPGTGNDLATERCRLLAFTGFFACPGTTPIKDIKR